MANAAAIRNQIDEVLSSYKLSNEQLEYVRDQMTQNLFNGLHGKKSSLKMLPSFVRGIPNGKECGDFLALDLGGTNFRVLRVKLPEKSDDRVEVDSQVYMVPETTMRSTGEELFDHIAECIEDFLTRHNLADASLPLGFTFSFPCVQNGLDNSFLLRWTKGFNATGVVGKDLAGLLHEALERRKLQSHLTYSVKVKAVINDTVGTMMTCAYTDHDCTIGMIVGTGSNACYMESEADIKTLKKEQRLAGNGRMCINTEWGGFGENGSLESIRTDCDRAVDKESINPGCMIFEKMISGMYMGEVVRYLLLNLVRQAGLFGGVATDILKTKGKFLTAFVTQIEADRSHQLKACSQILDCLGYANTTLEERSVVREACVNVSTRAANLCASGVAALVLRSRDIETKLPALGSGDASRFRITVGVDGTVYKKHPRFRFLLSDKVSELCPNCDVTFRQSSDGSGKGAALVTAVACRLGENIEADFTTEDGG
uniref:Phosphotransferase n=1 Tax=Phallusia mammillata TaxID=59560 RepID=A0A6F9DEH4_9ASCI|nr:hexokinase-2-like [Phallusia mammillata]